MFSSGVMPIQRFCVTFGSPCIIHTLPSLHCIIWLVKWRLNLSGPHISQIKSRRGCQDSLLRHYDIISILRPTVHTVLHAVPLQFIPSEKPIVAVRFIRQKAIAACISEGRIYAAQLL